MDGQAVEIIGRNRLIEQLLSAGIEVATPLRDRGIDLIAYRDRGTTRKPFPAIPSQSKVSLRPAFGVHRKYANCAGLVIVHLWNVMSLNDWVCYATTYAQAIAVADAVDWTETRSWRQANSYSTRRPSRRLVELLKPYRMGEAKWATFVGVERAAVSGLTAGLQRMRS